MVKMLLNVNLSFMRYI